jgi:hypothetical protein
MWGSRHHAPAVRRYYVCDRTSAWNKDDSLRPRQEAPENIAVMTVPLLTWASLPGWNNLTVLLVSRIRREADWNECARDRLL